MAELGAAPRCLVVGPAWVGDMVMAQSLFRTLGERSPGVSISVLAPAWTFPLLERMPEVAEAIEMPVGHGRLGLGERRRLGRSLRGRGFDHAIVLPGSWKSALVPWLARIPRRTGFVGEQRWGLLNDIRRLDEARLPLNVQRFVALGLPADAPAPDRFPRPELRIDPAARAAAAGRFGIDAGRPVLGLCPGAEYGPAKRWPAAHFAAVAAAQTRKGWQVLLFGSERERPITAEIDLASGGGCNDLAGKTRLGEAVDLMSLCDAVVSNDSGLMHVAAALGRRLVALYGSSSPAFTPPLGERCDILRLDLPCSPCFRRECPIGHLDCLEGIAPERVLALLEESPGREAGAEPPPGANGDPA